jgi:photosystem II stability/assembly factor-like uncharacterized protein
VNPLLAYLGSDDGVYRSENRGVSWVRTDPSPAGGDRVVALDADPFEGGVVLVGLSGTRGLFRSDNRGQTWAGASAGLPFTEPTDLDFARDVAGRVYVSLTTSGIYRSDDKGTTWSQFGLNSETVNAVEPAPSNSGYVYAASGATMYFLDPGVGTWTSATTGPESPITTIAVDATQPLTAYAGADHPGTAAATGGVYKTTDGGRNWSRLTGVLGQFDVVSLAAHPAATGTLYAATLNGGVYRSSDGGATWTELPNYGTVADLTNVTVKHPSNALLYAGTEGYGVQVSGDGGRTFAPRVTGLTNLNVNAIAFEPGSATVTYAGTDAGVFRSIDAGNTWAPTAQVTGEITDLLTDNEGTARRIWATVHGLGYDQGGRRGVLLGRPRADLEAGSRNRSPEPGGQRPYRAERVRASHLGHHGQRGLLLRQRRSRLDRSFARPAPRGAGDLGVDRTFDRGGFREPLLAHPGRSLPGGERQRDLDRLQRRPRRAHGEAADQRWGPECRLWGHGHHVLCLDGG